MDLLTGIIIGAIYARNINTINERVFYDVQRVALAFSRTGFATTCYYMIEAVYMAFERKFVQKNIYTHDILCTCNRRTCKPVSINTYVRKIKAVN